MKMVNIKFRSKTFLNELILIFRKLLSTPISKLRLITIIDMLIKTILFLTIIPDTPTAQNIAFNRSIKFSFVYIGFILLVYSFGYLFSKRKQTAFYIILNLLYSILLTSDLSYFRTNKDLLGIKNIFFSGTFNPTETSLVNFSYIDILFIIDIIIILAWIIIKKVHNPSTRNIHNFIFTLKTSLVMILISTLCFDVLSLSDFGNSIINKQWSTSMSVQAPGPLGYHIVEALKSASKEISLNSINPDDKTEIETWIKNNNENLEPNSFAGLFKGKNVIFLQIESMENFVLNQKANGKEITPFLNKLTKEGLYFNDFYEQNNGANSIDCDFMVNTSIFPLGDQITATNYGENVYPNSLPRILNNEGYKTISTHAELPGEFNWTELHKNGFGAQELWSLNDYNYDEVVGYGLSDRSFLTQLSEKLKNVKEPFFVQAPTLSSHGPFDIDAKYRELNLPSEINDSYLGGYFESLHYADKQIEMFFNKLKEYNLLDNTVVVIYGDHTGVHKYYNDSIQKLDFEGNWWKEYDHKIPLIMYTPNMKPDIIESSGGQVDLLPTISYLLGVDDSQYKNTSMGRVLVNTNRNSTVIKGNIIKGDVQNSNEQKHLLNAYPIGEKIIKNNFFNNMKSN
ncbi:LTA synthase family protein [Clostridium saccharobutylicum]|uniref:Lipoteichoic acid synthase-like YqgS n=1 Tax=Clostridium saccharobutylicum DSM 13864 TaxID=1345695 RepID=U5N054_CLOSA|nr:LTA synthase family protein [Clostridium saccharobutylicum]AGX45311.1 lipoteichoic acid synthase-like YqgS [Clostridium saccharobutylicum DSM 13864]AQR92585.1 lipoteichoic acid synthase 1 [Clostridium saccharobutylicum]AQS02487.1 lipoteichoic acid synthase 1 [Clostridium saccharobutylicum]AQS12090.1 lipoteichoic acid synthase 1 [Clostridium saccharobutylicum]AQS16470.1 lipoteichoic acid synthase 1 [Clostridium saccharobutylicum]